MQDTSRENVLGIHVAEFLCSKLPLGATSPHLQGGTRTAAAAAATATGI